MKSEARKIILFIAFTVLVFGVLAIDARAAAPGDTRVAVVDSADG